MRDLEARARQDQQTKEMLRVFGRMTGVLIFALGAVSVLSGVTGHDFYTRFFTRRWFTVHDAAVGAAFLALGGALLWLTWPDPATRGWRSIRDWGRQHWISVALTVVGFLCGYALILFRPLLVVWSYWGYYGLLTASSMLMVVGGLIWPKPRDRSRRG
jgi:hypothetical protein